MKTKWGSVYDGKQVPIEPGRWYASRPCSRPIPSPEKADGEQALLGRR